MPFVRTSIDAIGAFTPLVDYRKQRLPGILGGRNFAWDVGGIRSDFASRLISGSDSIADFGEYVQSVRIGDVWHVICGSKVWMFEPAFEGARVGSWNHIADLTPVQTTDLASIPEHLRSFTSVFVGGYAYVAHWNYGVYRVDTATNTYTRLTSGTVPGFPADSDPVYGIAETNGRVIYVTETFVYWSNANNAEDLTPALGGAGGQSLGEHIAGEPRSVLRVNSGVIVWTTSGALAGEFIGGNFVFRWYQISADIMPLNQAAAIDTPDGSYLVLTRLGLYRIVDLGQPSLISPLFGEFLREYLRDKPIESATTWYSPGENRIFVALRQSNSQYIETFCHDISLDKWGIFSHLHVGFINYAPNRGSFAYLNAAGIASHILPGSDSRKNREDPNNPGTYLGLDSMVEIGYIRAENMVLNSDTMQELTDLVIHRTTAVSETDATYVDEGVFESLALPDGDTFDEGDITDSDVADEIHDEGALVNQFALYNYRVWFVSDALEVDPETGIDYGVRQATRVQQKRLFDVWTGGVQGSYLAVRLEALEDGEYFRCQTMDATLAFSGQVIGG